jgi:DNA-binding HxlR family transcriptional regulator
MNQSLETATVTFDDLEYNSRVQAQPQCTVERTLEVIGGKWTTLILRDLLGGTRRFGELRRSLEGVSPKTLTDRLRFLETRGIVERRVHPEIPPRVEYTLTERGRELGAIIDAMAVWGAKNS